jgi:hypothetical protein
MFHKFIVSLFIILLFVIKFLKSNFKIKRLINNIINKKKIIIFQFKKRLNISFDANEVIYINKINIPPIKIKNKEYENQNEYEKYPVNKAIKIVCIIKINPIDKG